MKKHFVLCFMIILFVEFNAFGQSWQLTKTAGGTGIDQGNQIRIDTQGNYIIHGCAQMGADFEGTVFNYNGNFVAKYNSTGNLQWIIPAGNQDSSLVFLLPRMTTGGIETDDLGNIYIMGSFIGSTQVGDSIINGGSGLHNVFISKVSPSGVVLWNKYVTDNTVPTGIALDASGNLLICGFTEGISTFDSVVVDPFGTQNERDIVIAKYDSSGNFIWVRQCGGGNTSYSDRAFGIACDSQDNIIVVGQIRSDATFGGLLLNATNPVVGFNGFISKFDAAGNALWVHYCGYTGHRVTVSADGDIYPVGYTYPGWITGFDSLLTISGNNIKMFFAKLDASGNYTWAKSNTGDGFINAFDVASDLRENSYVTGVFNDTIYFGSHVLTAVNNSPYTFQSMYMVVYDSTGAEKWAHAIGGGAGSRAFGFGVDAVDSCSYAVTGSFLSPPSVIHIDTLTSFGSSDIYFTANTDNCQGSTTSIPETDILHQSVTVFPNPASTSITISLPFSGNSIIQIFDSSGKLMHENVTENKQLIVSLNTWNDGLYIVRIVNSYLKIMETSRFIKYVK